MGLSICARPPSRVILGSDFVRDGGCQPHATPDVSLMMVSMAHDICTGKWLIL